MVKFRKWLREQEVNEAKQVGTIYHFTRPHNIEHLLNKSKQEEYSLDVLEFISMNGNFSTTRNSSMTSDFTHPVLNAKNGYIVRLALDGDKLSNKYRIKPIRGLDDNSFDVFGNGNRVPLKWGENEEVILGNKNKKDETTFKLKDYLLQIDIVYISSMTKDETIEIRDNVEKLVNQNNLKIPVYVVKKFTDLKNTNRMRIFESELNLDNCEYLELIKKD